MFQHYEDLTDETVTQSFYSLSSMVVAVGDSGVCTHLLMSVSADFYPKMKVVLPLATIYSINDDLLLSWKSFMLNSDRLYF